MATTHEPARTGPDGLPPNGVTLALTLTDKLSQHLWVNASPNFYDEQPDRFEVLGDFDLPLPNDPVFSDGTVMWCATASDMLLLKAYEDARGYTATLLWDLAEADFSSAERQMPDNYVVLSSRSWAALTRTA